MSKKFITQEIRENVGKFERLSLPVALNFGVEPSGWCMACGKEIVHSLGVYHPAAGFLWVGSVCEKTLSADNPVVRQPDKITLLPASDKVALDKKSYDILANAGSEAVYSDRHGWAIRTKNSFYESLASQADAHMRKDGYYWLSSKQYSTIKKLFGELN